MNSGTGGGLLLGARLVPGSSSARAEISSKLPPDAESHPSVELTHVNPGITAPVSQQLTVSGLERSVRFYRDVLGFEVRAAFHDRAEVVRGPARIELSVATGTDRDYRVLFFETDDV